MTDSVLVILVALPVLAAAVIALLPRNLAHLARPMAIASGGIVLALSGWIWSAFDRSSEAMQFVFTRDWIPGLGASFEFGVDGLSLPLVVLTTLLTVLAAIASGSIRERTRAYFALLMLLEAGLIGVFISIDLVLFYLFWEIVLIPMFFLIAIWGGARRGYASVKFFLYTLAGSLAMLAGIIGLFLLTGAETFSLRELATPAAALPPATQTILFTALAFALAVKVPIVPFHTWLPDAHVEAPTAVSVLLAGVLLKMGSYGFLRLGPQLLPQGFSALAPTLAVLAVVSIVWGAAVALVQTDLKRLVAYSSVSHMGYVMLGIASGTSAGILGANVQMFSHGLIAAMSFLLVGALYERAHTREISAFGGIVKVAPVLAGTLVFASFASAGLPGMSGFIGEFMVVLGALPTLPVHAVIAAAAVVVTCGYLLTMLKQVVFGPLNAERADLPEMNGAEAWSIMPLVAITLIVGIFPQSLAGVMSAASEAVVRALGG